MNGNPWYADGALWSVLVAGVAAILLLRAIGMPGPPPDAMALLTLVLVYPVIEEWLFRGLLQPALGRALPGFAACGISSANFVSSLLFALAHWPQHGTLHAAFVFWPSLVFGLFRDRHDSVLPSIVLHASWNAAAALLLGVQWAPVTLPRR